MEDSAQQGGSSGSTAGTKQEQTFIITVPPATSQLGWRWDEHSLITDLQPGGAAEGLGIHKGDTILAVSGADR
jgi:predicted metalloprotease with PDZ domain